jgi:coproporphyrinogen III oxidase
MAESAAVKRYLQDLHDRITAAVEEIDTPAFRRDSWQRAQGGGGESRVLTDGKLFERAGVSFSHVHGEELPQSA